MKLYAERERWERGERGGERERERKGEVREGERGKEGGGGRKREREREREKDLIKLVSVCQLSIAHHN